MNSVLLHLSAGVSVLLSAGVGLTVIVNVCWAPAQPSNEGVTVIVAVTGAVPLLVAVNDGMFPEPLAARPIDGVLLLHEYVVVPPVRLVVKFTATVATPLHLTWSAGSLTWPDGLTVMVNV